MRELSAVLELSKPAGGSRLLDVTTGLQPHLAVGRSGRRLSKFRSPVSSVFESEKNPSLEPLRDAQRRLLRGLPRGS